jgi:predicted enzyme related to lactoylglutathione lyase
MRTPSSSRRRSALRGLTAAVVLVATGCTTASIAPPKGMAISKLPLIGKFVWRDLHTESPAAVKPFYASLFGWEYVETTAMGRPYTIVKSGGQPIGGIVKAERQVPQQPNSQWLSYMSVPDVDRATEQTRSAGGSVLAAPFDLPKVGRGAVVIDPQGAPLGLLRASFGDPADTSAPVMNSFLWTEELAHDPAAAAKFYADLVGFEVVVSDQGDKTFRVLKLGRDRAGVIRMPFAGMQSTWLVSVMVADPAASAERAQQLGGRVLLAPRADVRDGSVALVADPSGAVLALQKWSSK